MNQETCRYCGKQGHGELDCPTYLSAPHFDGGKCMECGSLEIVHPAIELCGPCGSRKLRELAQWFLSKIR